MFHCLPGTTSEDKSSKQDEVKFNENNTQLEDTNIKNFITVRDI